MNIILHVRKRVLRADHVVVCTSVFCFDRYSGQVTSDFFIIYYVQVCLVKPDTSVARKVSGLHRFRSMKTSQS